jgi:Ankyrin repeat
MSKKKTKSKVKAPSFTEVLKALYLEKITNKLSDEQFIVQVRAIAISASKKAKVLEEEIQLLKIVAQNYIAIFTKGKIITSEDIKTLASFTFEKWLKADDMLKVSMLILEGRSKALKLEAGTKEECEDIIITIGKLFAVQGVTKQMQSDYLIELIQGRFLKAAKLELSKGQFNSTDLKELLVRVFINTFELQDIQYLADVVDQFKIDLKSLSVQSKTGGICTALTFFLSLPTLELKEQYLSLLKKKGVHPDSDVDRPDFVAMDSMTLLMYCCNKGDRDSVDLLLKYGADINQVIKVVNKHGVITFRTPFSVSIGSADIDFVKYLVNQGANPTKAMNLFNEFIAKFVKKPLESNVRLIPTMGYGEISVEIREDYFSQVYSIMEQYYLQELLACSEFSEGRVFEEKESRKSATMSKHSVSRPQKKGVQELVSEYIDFKKSEQGFLKKNEATIENTFDILLLEFCQSGSEEILNQLHGHINSNP